jgi:glycosyltransferase involved in cell wall biosynthesis
VNKSCTPDTMHPDIAADGDPLAGLAALVAHRSRRGALSAASPSIAQRVLGRPDHVDPRASVGSARVPTIIAIGPFDDRSHAHQLAAAFIAVRQRCQAQLVLLGEGVQRAVVIRKTSERAVGTSVHVVCGSCEDRWSDVVATADVVVLSSSSGITTLLDVLAAGRAVVAPADPTTVQLVVPAIAGLVYLPGDLSSMTAALLRLLTEPVLSHGMGGRAINVARRHHLETLAKHQYEEANRV